MTLLGLDIGSSSVKAAILRGPRVIGRIAHAGYPTHFAGPRAEIDPRKLLAAITAAIKDLGPAARRVDAIALDVMCPAWLAMDRRGRPLTPIVTHQDRRSVAEARQIEARVGKIRHLKLAGNRPVPGGISSTTCAWFLRHAKSAMRRADLVGHLNTYLHRQLTGARVIDPSNASFTGLYRTLKTPAVWCDELVEAIGLSRRLLPDVRGADAIAGHVLPAAAHQLGLTAGTPMATGCVDTSSAMLLAGPEPGRLLNVMGSTDVLALCTDRPVPSEHLLTRQLGVAINGHPRWMSVATLASAGTSLRWAHQVLFADLSESAFWKMVGRLFSKRRAFTVQFSPYLAGDRVGVEQLRASFTGLTLATDRLDMLASLIDALARASADRLPTLAAQPVRMHHRVMLSGGGSRGPMRKVLHRDWPGRWTFFERDEATLRGLGTLQLRPKQPQVDQ
jgi:xylulokinase